MSWPCNRLKHYRLDVWYVSLYVSKSFKSLLIIKGTSSRRNKCALAKHIFKFCTVFANLCLVLCWEILFLDSARINWMCGFIVFSFDMDALKYCLTTSTTAPAMPTTRTVWMRWCLEDIKEEILHVMIGFGGLLNNKDVLSCIVLVYNAKSKKVLIKGGGCGQELDVPNNL